MNCTHPFAASQLLLREQLTLLLATLPPVLRADTIRALEEQGKLFSCPTPGSSASELPAGAWSLLTFLVAQHVSPEIDLAYAASVAVAVECLVCAIDLLDDVIDADQTPIMQALGIERVLIASTALSTLTQQVMLSLSENTATATTRILPLLNMLQASALLVLSGQYRDIVAEQRPIHDFTIEECLDIALTKSGSLMQLACQLGALCAGATIEVCNQFAELGKLLGIAHQLDNDCHDLYDALQDDPATGASMKSVKTDLVRGKKTLPIVLAAKRHNSSTALRIHENGEAMRAFEAAIMTTWGISLLYREHAHTCLQEIEAQTWPVAPALRLLLWGNSTAGNG